MNIRVNDQERAIDAGTTLEGLLHDLGLVARRGLAVAVNDAVVPRADWTVRPLAEADRVLVIQATQGG